VVGTNAIASMSFNWGDGTGATSTSRSIGGVTIAEPFAVHHYTVAGTYTLTLTVTDVNGLSSTASASITVNALPATTLTISSGNLGAQLNAAAANAVIRVNAGTYSAPTTWNPKAGQIVWASGAVIVDGTNSVNRFMINNTAGLTGLIIDGLEIKNFRSDPANGFTDEVVAPISTNGAYLKNCNIHDNGVIGQGGGGVNLYNASNLTLDNCHIHHNKVYAFSGAGGNPANTSIIGCEIDHNYTDTAMSLSAAHYPNVNDGVAKIVQSTACTYMGNNAHDNNGFGMWFDGHNFKTLCALNTFSNNAYGGFFNEISGAVAGDNLYGSGFSTLVVFNTFTDNHEATDALYVAHPAGSRTPPPTTASWTSSYMLWEYNIIDGGVYSDDGSGGADGVILDYSPRTDFAGLVCANNTVRNNDIRVGLGRRLIGITHNYGTASPSLPTGIASDHNHFYADNTGTAQLFSIPLNTSTAQLVTLATWRANGRDTNSTTAAYSAWPH
jgi:hypothetical protein